MTLIFAIIHSVGPRTQVLRKRKRPSCGQYSAARLSSTKALTCVEQNLACRWSSVRISDYTLPSSLFLLRAQISPPHSPFYSWAASFAPVFGDIIHPVVGYSLIVHKARKAKYVCPIVAFLPSSWPNRFHRISLCRFSYLLHPSAQDPLVAHAAHDPKSCRCRRDWPHAWPWRYPARLFPSQRAQRSPPRGVPPHAR
jgi:hypothetical protein